MKRKAIKAGFALSALALAVSPAMAAEIRFDGFASFVAGQVLDDDEADTSGIMRGFDDRLEFQNNSLFALQVRADLQDKLSATAQITAKGQDDYDAKFNWAYLTYEINNELSAKVGRQRIPYFMYSDFLDVGYAYHWIAPPHHVYNLGGFDSADGLSLDYQTEIGDWLSRVSLMTGRANTSLVLSPSTNRVGSEVSELMLATWSMSYDWLTLRAVYSQAELTIDLDYDAQVYTPFFEATGITISDASKPDIEIDRDRAQFMGVGFSIDPGKFFVVGELTELDLQESTLQNPSTQWYVSAGYRFGDFTVYGTYEGVESDYNEDGYRNVVANDIEPLPVPDFVKAALADGVQEIFEGSLDEETAFSIGMRYNFHKSAAIKAEFTQADNKVADSKPQSIAIAIDLVY